MEHQRTFRVSENSPFTTKRERELEIELFELRHQLDRERTDANTIIGHQQRIIEYLSRKAPKQGWRCTIC